MPSLSQAPVGAANSSLNGDTPQPPQQIVVAAAADNEDEIDREAAHQALKIISETHDDPYNQTERLAKLRADFMFKKYNKKMKTE